MEQHWEFDGEPAGAAALGEVLGGYGHFTYMQVRDRSVRGLDLHLERLERATRELFGRGLDSARVLSYVRRALENSGRGAAASVRVQVVPADPAAVHAGATAEPRVLVAVRPPAQPAAAAQRLRTVEYERLLPHLKHLDTMGLVHHARQARRDGFDDVLFTDRHGHITESSLANVVLHDDHGFVWPDSPALPGIMRGLLRRGLAKLDVPVRDRTLRPAELAGFRSMFLTNSVTPAQPVASVDEVLFTVEESARSTLWRAYEANPWDSLGC